MEPVAFGVKQPDLLGNISQLLGIKSMQQGLAGQQAEVQMRQRENSQEAALASHDFTQYMGPDGLPDINQMAGDRDLRQKAGTKFFDVLSHAATVRQQMTENQKSLLGLNSDALGAVQQQLGGLRSDPDIQAGGEKAQQKLNATLASLHDSLGDSVLPVLRAYSPSLQDAAKHGKLDGALKSVQMQANSVGSQVGAQSPQYADNGPSLIQTNPNAIPGQQPDSIQKGISPGYSLFVDPRTQNPYRVDNQTGRPSDLGGPSPGAAPGSLPRPYYPGQGSDVEKYQSEVQATRQAGDQAPLAANINRTILELSRDAKTGPGSEKWQHAIGAIGAPFGLSPSASYQEVGKFLEKNAIAQMTSMGGPPSDARLSAASAANGSTHFSPEALQAVTKFNDATTTALMQYRQGIDRAVGTQGNVDYTALPKFKAEWAKNFDVNIFRIENALRDGDKEELAKVRKELGKEGMQRLIDKRKKLNELSGAGGG